jgi:CMP-2-keto-3-deoxyoctulosonic acid synthetase
MSLKVRNDMDLASEQKINRTNKVSSHLQDRPFDLDLSLLVYNAVKTILEKDQYDLLHTKSKLLYDKRIQVVDKRINHLIGLNGTAKEQTKKLVNSIKLLKIENENKLRVLAKKLMG